MCHFQDHYDEREGNVPMHRTLGAAHRMNTMKLHSGHLSRTTGWIMFDLVAVRAMLCAKSQIVKKEEKGPCKPRLMMTDTGDRRGKENNRKKNTNKR